ncbi:alpha/beta hydrolase [Variovorax sp. N23]|uniref:alpha/beta hydrolase n=1 Tax=Variovorax sp. N23 TaxID=2980555 RepID=UPI0021CA7E1A|nr:alpha/beta hydrolase [Variovorax sp. N23]MCU4118586.1 alpha/beta hydrolase [Variovorax sp. N23]
MKQTVHRATAALLALVAVAALAAPPADVRRLDDLPYGTDARQRMDVFLPAAPREAPILLMVHGGAWMVGDKSMSRVVDAKVAHWVGERGSIVVSINYRMVPEVDVQAQARDVATALATVQARAAEWGGDPSRLVLMGHSAGAHLVALLSADPARAAALGAGPWRGTVVLDSAAIDTVALMSRRHLRLYDRVFGADPAYWRSVSPTAALTPRAVPTLVVCSTLRRDDSCGQAKVFVDRARAVGARSELLPQALDHADVNGELGRPGAYTASVDAFIDRLLDAR